VKKRELKGLIEGLLVLVRAKEVKLVGSDRALVEKACLAVQKKEKA